MSDGIIGMQKWFETPPGRYLLAWERAEFDRAVSDIFGFHVTKEHVFGALSAAAGIAFSRGVWVA